MSSVRRRPRSVNDRDTSYWGATSERPRLVSEDHARMRELEALTNQQGDFLLA